MSIIDDMLNPDSLKGRETGYSELDEITGGLRIGALCVLAGATGMGKSLLGINILCRMAKMGVKCAYVDLENGKEVSYRRLFKIFYGLTDGYFVADGDIQEKKADLIYKMNNINRSGIIYIDHEKISETKGYTTFQLVLRYLEAHPEIDLFLIDPLQVMESNDLGGNEYKDQGNIVQLLKEFAQKNKKTIILCHHIRKSTGGVGEWVEDIDDTAGEKYRIPNLNDLRGSGKISDFATDVWAIVRSIASKDEDGRSKTLLRVLKNRNGNLGDTRMKFNVSNLTFTERTGPFYVDIFPNMGI